MREIKFRGLVIDGEWIYGTPVFNIVVNANTVEGCEIVKEISYDELDHYARETYSLKVDPKSVGQYTGLKDKNGKEIYEGDIIQVKTSSYGEYIAPVAYHTESAFFATDNHQAKQIKNPENWTLEHDKVDSYGFCMDRYSQLIGGYNNTYNHNSKSYDIEIIGNIHQNKELLNDSIRTT